MNNILSVSELTNQIKQTLENGYRGIGVLGEISNFKAHVSGHWYFTLKDSGAQINCAMWRSLNNQVFFTPQDGMKILVKGNITVYPPRGNYQIDVRSMQPAGEGELQAAFERLKKKLSVEGIFNEDHKKAIPQFPEKIGIVTAIDGAALKDMISIAQRRYPLTELIVASSKVQGEGAAQDIVRNINELNKLNDIDLIIVGRGGGSLEDLWAFNEEIVARAIFDSKIPIISGVGHEIDFTISDFVADLRAPTPSAAMEIATPNIDEIFAFISNFSYNSTNNISENISGKKEEISQILNSYGFRLPEDRLRNRSQFLDHLYYRIKSSIHSKLKHYDGNLSLLTNSIEHNNFNKILKKGFALIRQGDKFVSRAAKFNLDKSFEIKFFDKEVKLKINE